MIGEATVVTVGDDLEVALPTAILDSLGVKPGHEIEFVDTGNGKIILRRIETSEERAKRIKKDALTKLREFHATLNIDPDHEPFDIHEVRRQMIGR